MLECYLCIILLFGCFMFEIGYDSVVIFFDLCFKLLEKLINYFDHPDK
jgi:hypothetical protein